MRFIMQVIDADYFLKDGKPVLRIFGKKPDGKSACCMQEGFMPYFYAEYKEGAIAKARELGLDVEIVERKRAIGYQTKAEKFCKITARNPQDIPQAREAIAAHAKCYEADILFIYRYMIDNGIRGMGWVSVDAERINTTTLKKGVEGYIAKEIRPIKNVSDAPLRHMCFDIECLQLDSRRAPEASRDPIIMIAAEFYPEHKERKGTVLVSKRNPGLPPYAKTFDGEKEMIEYFIHLIEEYDPDIITGYNINGYDVPYLEERMRKHKLNTALGRCDKPIQIRKFAGSREARINGRVVVDSYDVIKRDVYIRMVRYNLGTVAREMLGEDKHDVKYTEIPAIWEADTKRLVEYARQDAKLAMSLLLKKNMLDKFIEISKISGVLLQDSLRGQSVRIENMLMREYAGRGMIIPQKPVSEGTHDGKYTITGGAVLEPEKGLHTDSVIVLDFLSLYPSIIKTYNISPDTLITEDSPKSAEYNEAPNGARFVKKEVYEGVFPRIIESLLAARSRAKKEMAGAKEEDRQRLDAKQYALKIMANSFYGYSGYVRARLFVSEMANAITAYGRNNIEKSKKIAESSDKVRVIYGDTDSIFLKTDDADLERVQMLGERIAKDISEKTGLVLEFEKIYRTFLILTKKRYAGWKCEKRNRSWIEGMDMRGIETVRRDWCPLVTGTLNDILHTILKERNVRKALDIVKNKIADLSQNRIPMEDLVVVKGITKTPSAYDGVLPHIELAKKIARRNPGAAPTVGDRIGFVITRGNDLLSKRAEDPDYAKEKGMQIDPEYYINNQLLPPIERILQAAGIERSEILGTGKQSSMLDISPAKNTCVKCGQAYRRIPIRGTCDCGGMIAGAG